MDEVLAHGHKGSAPCIPVWKVLAHGEACISQHLCSEKWNPVLESHQPLRFCKPPPELLGQRDVRTPAFAQLLQRGQIKRSQTAIQNCPVDVRSTSEQLLICAAQICDEIFSR